jgi:hypothetical protein
LLEGEQQQQQGFAQSSFFLLLLKVSRSVGVKSGRKIWYGWFGAIISRDELFLPPFSDFPLSGKLGAFWPFEPFGSDVRNREIKYEIILVCFLV